MKILILKPSSLGDVIHAMPVLRLLKLHLPKSEIHWWLDANLMPLLDGDPDLAGIIPFERKRWGSVRRWPEMVASIMAMRAKQFDVAIDLQGLGRSAFFAWLANAELTVGLDNLREGGRDGASALYDRTPTRAVPNTHAVDRYLAVLPLLKVPVHLNFEWLPKKAEVAARVQEKWQPGHGPWIALLPGARWDNKRWPAEYFATVAKLMGENPEARFVILGSGNEKSLGELISAANPGRCLNLAGETTLWEMIEWIRLCRLMITNDTGPMHVAAALNKPVVALFGPTDPLNTGPYRQLHNVIQVTDLPCVPCMKGYCTYKETVGVFASDHASDGLSEGGDHLTCIGKFVVAFSTRTVEADGRIPSPGHLWNHVRAVLPWGAGAHDFADGVGDHAGHFEAQFKFHFPYIGRCTVGFAKFNEDIVTGRAQAIGAGIKIGGQTVYGLGKERRSGHDMDGRRLGGEAIPREVTAYAQHKQDR